MQNPERVYTFRCCLNAVRAIQDSVHLVRDALVLSIAKSQVHVLQTLCCSTLEQVVNGSVDHDTLARAVNSEATNLNSMLARDVLDQRRLASNLDELLSGVSVLVQVADVARGHGLVERDGDGMLRTVSL